MWPKTVHINFSYYRISKTFLSKNFESRQCPHLAKEFFLNVKKKKKIIIESTFSCRYWGLFLSPYIAQFCTLALSQVPVRFICLLACGVSCPCVSCMNNSWRSKAFAENHHEQLLAQILPSVLILNIIIAPKLQSRSGSSYKYL